MATSFRVRHLQSMAVKNLNVESDDLNRSAVFFALSTLDNESLGYFYESSKCDNVLNPYWENLDLSYENIRRFSFLDKFIITFFVNKNTKNKIIAEIKVHISGLSTLQSLSSYHSKKEDSSFLFQFNNTIYSFDIDEPTLRNKSFVENPGKAKVKKPIYSKETINTFLTNISEKYQSHVSSVIIERQNLESQIYDCKHKIRLVSLKRKTIATYVSQIKFAKNTRDAKQKELFQIKLSNTVLADKINRAMDNSDKLGIEILRSNTLLKRQKDSYVKTSNEYMLRMYQLIHELARVFPITPTELPQSSSSKPVNLPANDTQSTTITIRSSDKLSIVNLHLSNNDKEIIFTQDVSSFAALGMVYRLLTALSQIYDIPLRYPLISIGVKTMIRDNIIDIEDHERNFLLIKNSSENFRLQYAIYLLNLNIVAIRGYFSLTTKYPDRTLWNINTLIEGKNRILGSGTSDYGSNQNLATLCNNNHMTSSSSNCSPHSSRLCQKPSPLLINNSCTDNQKL